MTEADRASRIQPHRTLGHEVNTGLKSLVKTGLPGLAETTGLQTPVNFALQALSHSLDPHINAPSWIDSFVNSWPVIDSEKTFLRNIGASSIVALTTLGGAFLADRQIQVKTDSDLAPTNNTLQFLWKESIRLQLASFSMGFAKTAIEFEKFSLLLSNFKQRPDFLIGYGLSILGGFISVADEFLIHQEQRNSLNEMLPSFVAFGCSLAGFLLSPVEVKPQVAAFTVTAFGNLVENLIEVCGRGKGK